MRQVKQQPSDLDILTQTAQGEFADHEVVDQHLVLLQHAGQGYITVAKMVDPDRRIDQD
jgi:hypothetical protein